MVGKKLWLGQPKGMQNLDTPLKPGYPLQIALKNPADAGLAFLERLATSLGWKDQDSDYNHDQKIAINYST